MSSNFLIEKRLSEIAKVIDCKHRTPKYVETGVPLVSPGTIKWGALDLISPVKRVSNEESVSLMDHCHVEIGDLVLSRNQSVGIASYVESDDPFVLGQDTVLIKPIEAESKFIYYKLQSDLIQKRILRLVGGSTFSRINLADIRNIKFDLPLISEQKKIAAILSTWDDSIAANEDLLANSRLRKKALMQQLLTGKKRLPGFEDDWATGLLSDICLIKKGGALSSKDIVPGPYPVIAGGQSSPYKHNSFNFENTITVSASGAYAGFVAHHPDRIWASDCSVIIPIETSCIDYIYQAMLAKQDSIYSLQSGGAQPHIYPRDLQTIEIGTPSLEEQIAISRVLSIADKEIEALEQRINNLKLQKKSLMQQLLTGKKRVKVEPVTA